jgi:hypothetical protein
MTAQALPSLSGDQVELDLCYACHGLWFDPQENLKLAPAAVVALFRLLHHHRDDARQPLALKLGCPRCRGPLMQGFDVVRSGRYVTYRCPQRHGRFSAFSSFMIEKGFVRQLTRPEIENLARQVAVLHCTSCGAPVDIRQEDACPHCRSTFSLVDPQAVEHALQGYASTIQSTTQNRLPELADALVMLERDRQKALRDEQARRGSLFTTEASAGIDLWAAGMSLVGHLLD